jgi:Ras family protein A
MAEAPEVTILLLGDAEVGKSMFLSYVQLQSFCPKPSFGSFCHSFRSLTEVIVAYRKISKGSSPSAESNSEPITLLKDTNQPFVFDIKFYDRPYRFEFYDTASPETWKLLHPHVVVLCYDISSRLSLINIQRYVGPLLLVHRVSNSLSFIHDLLSSILI